MTEEMIKFIEPDGDTDEPMTDGDATPTDGNDDEGEAEGGEATPAEDAGEETEEM